MTHPTSTLPDPFAFLQPDFLPWLLPPLRQRPIAAYAALWRHAGKALPRDLQALALLGLSGWSSRLALDQWLAAHDPQGGDARMPLSKRLWRRLQQRGLVQQRSVLLGRKQRLSAALVDLTDAGRQFLLAQGLACLVLSEWQRLRLAHQGDEQPRHTAMVILAAHLFRQHGLLTLVCPPRPGPFAPDLLLFDAAARNFLYVEIEAPDHGGQAKRQRRRRKWQAMVATQGFVALCALTPHQRGQRMRSARQIAAHGLATDLVTLSRQAAVLWPRTWGTPPFVRSRSTV